MTTEEVTAGNKLIKEFMEYQVLQCKYHLSWSELMPVFEKVRQLGYYYLISEWQTKICKYKDYSGIIAYDSIVDMDTKSIDISFRVIIDFINYYNSQSNNSDKIA
jgi:hypothetical protein